MKTIVQEPKITKTKNGWRVDLPDGDFCYQPSEQFAISYIRRWQVARNMAHVHDWRPTDNWLIDRCAVCGEERA